MWYINYNGQQYGPMEKHELLSYGLSPESYVWKSGMRQWQEARNFPELMELIYSRSNNSQYPPHYGAYSAYVPSNKDHIGAGLLAIFLGYLGVQYFYIGKTGAGLLTILLSFITCGIWSVVMFIQGIVMLTMTQEQFDKKYVYTDSSMPLF